MGEEIGFVCLGPWGVCLSTFFWSFVVVYLICVSTLFSSLFCFDALEYAYGPTLQMHPNVCYHLLRVSTSLFSFDALEYA